MKANVKQLKSKATEVALPVMGGLMVSNALSKVVPLKNEKLKAVLPLIAGLGTATLSGNKSIQNVGVGMAVYGTIKTLRSLLSGATGVNGITDNPMVQKMVDYLLPNLGNTDYPIIYSNSSYGNAYSYEPFTEDIDHIELNGIIDENLDPYSVNGIGVYANPYSEERYMN